MTDILDGSYEPPVPAVGQRSDGAGLFYPGRIHSVAGETETGKSWFALDAVATELRAGRAAIYLDFEDTKGGITGRLLALGAPREAVRDRFAYIQPEESVTGIGCNADLGQALGDLGPVLVILDGVTEAMALHGMEMTDHTDVARFGKLLPRQLAATGPAVVSLDHVVKNREARGRYAIGGVHKMNGLNGAAYTLENRQPFGIGRTGRSGIYVAKDRPGQVRRHALPSSAGDWFGDLVLKSHDETFVESMIYPPVKRDDADRPAALMAKVADALTRAGRPLNKREIEDRVKTRAADTQLVPRSRPDGPFPQLRSRFELVPQLVPARPKIALLSQVVRRPPYGGRRDELARGGRTTTPRQEGMTMTEPRSVAIVKGQA